MYCLIPDICPSGMGWLSESFTESLSDSITNITTDMHVDRQSRKIRVLEAIDEILILTSSVEDDDDFFPSFYQELGGKSKGVQVSPPPSGGGPVCISLQHPPLQISPFQGHLLEDLQLCWPLHGRSGNLNFAPKHLPS
jgi:hypothetical protein